MIKRFLKGVLPARLWTQLRLARIRPTLSHYPVRQTQHIYGGLPLTVHLADPLGEGWYDHDWPDLPEIAFLREHRLKTGAKVFDLGAHQCVVALLIADEVGSGGPVVTVEASEHNVAVGKRNREINSAEQLRIIHAAVAENPASLRSTED